MVRGIRSGEQLLAKVRIVVAEAGPDLAPLVEVEEGDELQAGDDLTSDAEPRGLPARQGTRPGLGIETREGPRPFEDHRTVLDDAEEEAKAGRPEAVEGCEVALHGGIDIGVGSAGGERAAPRDEGGGHDPAPPPARRRR